MKRANTDKYHANECEYQDILREIERLNERLERLVDINIELSEQGIDKQYLSRLYEQGIDPKALRPGA